MYIYVCICHDVVQPVPDKMRLGMVIGMEPEVEIRIKKLLFWVSFHLKI
jgi:hypothetical protein